MNAEHELQLFEISKNILLMIPFVPVMPHDARPAFYYKFYFQGPYHAHVVEMGGKNYIKLKP